MCDPEFLRRSADIYFENECFVYASTRDPATPVHVLPGSVLPSLSHTALAVRLHGR
jgi:hypothetical protein